MESRNITTQPGEIDDRKSEVIAFVVNAGMNGSAKKQNRSTEGCLKLKSPETKQVQERLVSTLEHMQVPKWDRTRCPEE